MAQKKTRFVALFVILISCNLFFTSLYAEEILTWENCLTESKKNHPDLISAEESYNQKKSDTSVTASGLWPQAAGSFAVSRTQKTGSSKSTTDAYSYGVSATQLIFDGFKKLNDINSAAKKAEAAQGAYRFTSSQVRLNLRLAFVNLLKAQQLISVTEEIIKIRKANYDLISLRYESGLEHKGALLTSEANLAQADFEYAQAKRNIEVYQRQLTREMGRAEFKPFFVTGEFMVSDPVKQKPNFLELSLKNPNLDKAAATRKVAEYDVKSSYADFVPEISGTGGAEKNGARWAPRTNEWNLGLSVTLPIFEGGLRLAQISKAKAALRQALADERSLRDSIVVSLHKTWAALEDALDIADVQKKKLLAAEERARIAEAQYSTGFITFDNWIIIQNDLVNAKTSYLGAEANMLIAEANWIQAKGDTLEYVK